MAHITKQEEHTMKLDIYNTAFYIDDESVSWFEVFFWVTTFSAVVIVPAIAFALLLLLA